MSQAIEAGVDIGSAAARCGCEVGLGCVTCVCVRLGDHVSIGVGTGVVALEVMLGCVPISVRARFEGLAISSRVLLLCDAGVVTSGMAVRFSVAPRLEALESGGMSNCCINSDSSQPSFVQFAQLGLRIAESWSCESTGLIDERSSQVSSLRIALDAHNACG